MSDALLITTFAGFGDVLYQTPLIRLLKRLYDNVDVWCRNYEPLVNNPYIRSVYKMDSFFAPDPFDFYFLDIYRTTSEPGLPLIKMPQSNFHAIDFFSIGAVNLTLRPKEKDLELFWTKKDEESVRELLTVNGLITNEHPEKANFIVICPAITWPSRTLPLDFYKELIHLIQTLTTDKVVIVGKDLAYTQFDPDRERENKDFDKYRIDEKEKPKQLYPISEFPGVIDLTNRLSLHQLGALYSLSKIAVNTENGNMVVSCTNDKCWNIYIPTLTAPEYRVPYRHGSMDWKTIVVGNDDDYYPASSYGLEPKDLVESKIKIPTVEKTFLAYLKARECFKYGHSIIR